MKISKKVLGALAVGIALQVGTSSCDKKETKPKVQQPPAEKNVLPVDSGNYCPACGMG